MRPQAFRPEVPTLSQAIDRVCLSLFVASIISVIYRFSWAEANDRYKCNALLTNGRWLDAADSSNTGHSYQNWQPQGCIMHKYKAKDLESCLTSRKIVYVGDSTVRQIFWATARKIDPVRADKEMRVARKHTDLVFNGPSAVTVEFFWDPYLNSSQLHRELTVASLLGRDGGAADSAAILMVGGGLWHARHLGEHSLHHFNHSVKAIASPMAMDPQVTRKRLAHITSLRPDYMNSLRSSGSDSMVFLSPVQIPLYESLTPSRAESITHTRVNSLNEVLLQLSNRHNISIPWAYSLMTWHRKAAYDSNGLHVVGTVADTMADLLLNMRCNAQLSSTKGYPMDKTCCISYQRPNWTQAVILTTSLILLPCLLLFSIRDTRRASFFPPPIMLRAITVLAMTVCYCFFADRTQLWNKAQKQYTSTVFNTLCVVLLLAGILSIRRSILPNAKSDNQFLSRDQTDEWKGWMQLVILVYHWTGASKVLWIYEIIRVLVASYLFMTGYGHAVFFYKKADYSLRRSASVLVRLNMLSCILPYVMKTDYLFYYFAPLISFWYMVIYITMAVAHSRNGSLAFLTGKIVISAALITALVRLPGILETLFHCLEKCCNIHWDVIEWRFRLQLDGYIIYVGMLCGVLCVRTTDAISSHRGESNHLNDLIRKHCSKLRVGSLIFAFLTLPAFYVFARSAPDKFVYNSFVPYTSAFPILAFVVLRNCTPSARNFYSSAFAWIGRHSLETFTLQFHIWLAADTKGLLSTGMFERWGGRPADLILLSVIFLWVSWHVAAATQTITRWIIDPRDVKVCVEQNTEANGGNWSLPRIKDKKEMGGLTLSRVGRALYEVGAGAKRGVHGIKKRIAGDLRVRLGIILLVLWGLNMTYA